MTASEIQEALIEAGRLLRKQEQQIDALTRQTNHDRGRLETVDAEIHGLR